MQSIPKQIDQSDVGIAVKKAKSVGTVGIRNSKVDHQGGHGRPRVQNQQKIQQGNWDALCIKRSMQRVLITT